MTDKNEFHMPFMMNVDKAAKIIIEGIKKEKRVIEFPLPIVLATKLINILPNFLFDRLAGKKPPARKDNVFTD
jgi:short-subunit dehydrogenase